MLLDGEGRARLADVGLARDADADVNGGAAGTAGYLAPEYASTGRATTASDVFALGVVFLELLSGKPAVEALRAKSLITPTQ